MADHHIVDRPVRSRLSKSALLGACALGVLALAAPREAFADCTASGAGPTLSVLCDTDPPNPDAISVLEDLLQNVTIESGAEVTSVEGEFVTPPIFDIGELTGAFLNDGSIIGDDNLITIGALTGDFTNNGVIRGSADAFLGAATVVVNGSTNTFVNTGLIEAQFDGPSDGIGERALDFRGDVDAFSNTGDVLSEANDAVRIVYSSASNGTFSNSGVLIGGDDGFQFQGSFASFTNSGVIEAGRVASSDNPAAPLNDGVVAIALGAADGTIESFVNQSTGVIDGVSSGVAVIQILDMQNAGTISGDQLGVLVGNDFNAAFAGLPPARILADGETAVSLVNTGVIRGGAGSNPVPFAADGVPTAGLFVAAGTAEMIDNSGVIEGGDFGIQAAAIDALVNRDGGVIRGLNDPSNGLFVLGDLGTLDNAGVIEATNGTALFVGDVLADGINTGTIQVLGLGGEGAVDETAAISAGRIGTFVNEGSILGGATGVGAFGAGLFGAGAIENFDNRSGAVIRARDFGIIGGDDADVIRNAGVIETTNAGGVAVDLQGGDDQLTLVGGTGYGLTGALLGGDGLDTLILEGVNQTSPLNLSSVSGFEALLFGANADWAFTGAANELGVTIAEGARFSGSGGFGSLEVLSGGVVAPGGSIGTIDVLGDVIFRSGSIFEVEVDENGADRLNAGGIVTIEDGSILQVDPFGSDINFTTGDQFVIIEALGGLNGDFGQLNSNQSAIGFSTTISGNQLLLNVAPANFDDVATDPNQSAVGGALGEAAGASAEVAAVNDAVAAVAAVDPDAGAAALQTLSGQPHAESVQGAAQAAQQTGAGSGAGGGGVGGAVTGAARIGGGSSPFSAYIGPVLTFGGQDSGGLSGYDVTNRGFGGGADFDLRNGLTGGVTLAYSRFRAESTQGLGRTTSNNVTIGARSTLVRSGWTFKAAGSYTFLIGMESVRNIEIGDQVLEARADIDAFTVATNGSITYTFAPKPFAKNAVFAPFTFVDYVRFDRDGFTETGASGDSLIVNGRDFGAFDANLSVDDETFDSVLLGGGLNTSWRIEGDKLGYGPSLLLGVSYEAGDDEGLSGQQFSAVDQGIGDFATNAEARNRVFGRAGVGLIISPKFLDGGFGFGYEAQIDADQVQHVLGFRATQKF